LCAYVGELQECTQWPWPQFVGEIPLIGTKLQNLHSILAANQGHQPGNAFHAVTTKQHLLEGINIDPSFDFNHMINTEN
jgi:hypothetical protein